MRKYLRDTIAFEIVRKYTNLIHIDAAVGYFSP